MVQDLRRQRHCNRVFVCLEDARLRTLFNKHTWSFFLTRRSHIWLFQIFVFYPNLHWSRLSHFRIPQAIWISSKFHPPGCIVFLLESDKTSWQAGLDMDIFWKTCKICLLYIFILTVYVHLSVLTSTWLLALASSSSMGGSNLIGQTYWHTTCEWTVCLLDRVWLIHWWILNNMGPFHLFTKKITS